MSDRRRRRKAKIKSNVRLFSASDVIWMLMQAESSERKIVDAKVSPEGIHLRMEDAIREWDWPSVACELGFDSAELVIGQFRDWHVLLYDKEDVDVEGEA